jgi:hypothetical protein
VRGCVKTLGFAFCLNVATSFSQWTKAANDPGFSRICGADSAKAGFFFHLDPLAEASGNLKKRENKHSPRLKIIPDEF